MPGRFLGLFLLERKMVSENGVVTVLPRGVVFKNGFTGLEVVVGGFCNDWIEGPISLKFVP